MCQILSSLRMLFELRAWNSACLSGFRHCAWKVGASLNGSLLVLSATGPLGSQQGTIIMLTQLS